MREAVLPEQNEEVMTGTRDTLDEGVRLPYQEELTVTPWRFDWFNLMRWLEARNPGLPRFGLAVRPADEVVRVNQKPELGFAPAEIHSISRIDKGRVRIEQFAFGLHGPNGPLPLHLTEFAHAREVHERDRAQAAFSDIFNHRFALLFYRAWASAQSSVSLDRPGEDVFSRYVGSVAGIGSQTLAGRDRVPDAAKRYFAGHLVRGPRNPGGLVAILGSFFGCRFRVEEWIPQRLAIPERERTRVGGRSSFDRLGRGAVCGVSLLDRQHRFRLHAGPMKLAEYESFLPLGPRHETVRDWVRNYVSFEFKWDLRLVLRAQDVPAAKVGGAGRLGWTTWLGGGDGRHDRGDLVLDCERSCARKGEVR